MIQNISYPIPTIGRIAIGEIFEDEKGRRLPRRLNYFRITTQHKRDGAWVEHPITKAVAAKQGVEPSKLTSIPVKVMVNDPDLIIRERYEAYTKEGRILCAGMGGKGKRLIDGKIECVECHGADICQFGIDNRCDLMTRVNLQIDVENSGDYTEDEMSTFILRSSGINTARTLNRKLNYLAKLFGNRLIGVPFILKLRQKSSTMSKGSQFYYVDLVLAVPIKEAIKMAKAEEEDRQALGFDQAAFEAEIRSGIDNGPFEESQETFEEMEDLILGRYESAEINDKPDSNGVPQSHLVDAASANESMEALRAYLDSASVPDLEAA